MGAEPTDRGWSASITIAAGPGQALKYIRLGPFDGVAGDAGVLCGRSRTADPIDASVALNAVGTSSIVATSDPVDIRRLVRALAPDEAASISILRV